jgi:hypothetical protein
VTRNLFVPRERVDRIGPKIRKVDKNRKKSTQLRAREKSAHRSSSVAILAFSCDPFNLHRGGGAELVMGSDSEGVSLVDLLFSFQTEFFVGDAF